MDLTATPTAADFAAATKTGVLFFSPASSPQPSSMIKARNRIEVRKAKDSQLLTARKSTWQSAASLSKSRRKSAPPSTNPSTISTTKKLFDFAFTDPSKVDLNGKLYLKKTGDKWFNASTQIDSASLQNVVDKLRDLAATKFPDHIALEPKDTLKLAVTWGDKSKVDKVVIYKNGEDYTASREGDTTNYALDPKAYADLQQAIAAIKPFQTPKPDTNKK